MKSKYQVKKQIAKITDELRKKQQVPDSVLLQGVRLALQWVISDRTNEPIEDLKGMIDIRKHGFRAAALAAQTDGAKDAT